MPDDMIREGRERYNSYALVESDNLTEMLQDLRFRGGEQWDLDIKRRRLADGRPVFTINRLPQFTNQVIGNIRMNPPQSKIRAASGTASKDTAATINGIVRNIEAQSRAQQVYIAAAENQVNCGQGFWRVTTQYSDDDGWDQDLRIERIMSPLAVLFDTSAVNPIRDDAEDCFVSEWIPLKTFKKRFPKASVTGWDGGTNSVNDWTIWLKQDAVRICEWWRKVPTKRTLLLLENLQTLDITDMDRETVFQAVAEAGGYRREREVDSHRVTMTLMNGVEELQERTDWAGKYLPIVPVIGQEVHIGERVIRHGIIRYARDAQKLFNIHRSAMAEGVASAPKAKWQGTMKQFEGFINYYASAHRNNYPVLPYNVDGNAPGPPVRIAPEMPNQALITEIGMATQDMEATTGIYREQLGKETNAESGEAIIRRQRQGDVGTFVYSDNLAEAVAHTGRILVDLIPKIYDTERVVRTLGEDGSENFVRINFTDPMTGKKVNDISAGEYDVEASVGPAYGTRLEEQRSSMVAFFQAVPQAANIAPDLLAKAMDWTSSDEIAARLRAPLVAAGVAKPEEGDPPPAPQKPDANMMLAEAEMAKAQAQAQKAQIDGQIKAGEMQIKAAELELERARLMLEARKINAEIGMEMGALKLDGIRTLAGVIGQIAEGKQRDADRQQETVAMLMDDHHRGADREMRRTIEHAAMREAGESDAG